MSTLWKQENISYHLLPLVSGIELILLKANYTGSILNIIYQTMRMYCEDVNKCYKIKLSQRQTFQSIRIPTVSDVIAISVGISYKT